MIGRRKMFSPAIYDADVQQSYKEQWNTHGWLALDGVLEPTYYTEITKTIPNLAYDYRGGVGDSYETISSTQPAEGNMLRDKITYSLQDGEFSYFHRIHGIDENTDIDNPWTNEFAKDIATGNLNGAVFRDWVQTITGFENLSTVYPTFSFYKYDNWITSHFDPKRKVAYLFYFNDVWKKEWGGELCLQDEQGRVTTTLMPLGNRLMLLDVSKPNKNKHFVSPCSYIAPPRYSFVGWFN